MTILLQINHIGVHRIKAGNPTESSLFSTKLWRERLEGKARGTKRRTGPTGCSTVPTYRQREHKLKKAKSGRAGHHVSKSRRRHHTARRAPVKDTKREYRTQAIRAAPLSRLRLLLDCAYSKLPHMHASPRCQQFHSTTTVIRPHHQPMTRHNHLMHLYAYRPKQKNRAPLYPIVLT